MKCRLECVEESHKCQDAGGDEQECHDKFVACTDKCEQGRIMAEILDLDLDVENPLACTAGDGSCRKSMFTVACGLRL